MSALAAEGKAVQHADLDAFLARHGDVGAAPSLKEGTVVDGWRVTGFLGRGGSAEVYCVRRSNADAPAALKILHRVERRHVERFAREARFLEDNSSPSFPRFYGCGSYDGRPFVAIELLEPISLPRRDGDVARYLCSIAAGLELLHMSGYVHRDVKPRNVMCRKDGTPVLIDLGLIKEISDGEGLPADSLSVVDGRVVGVGTPRYAAPEQFAGGGATPATDIHALGRLVYECFDGKPPRCWSRIIRRATSSIPSERFQSAGDFIRAVRRRHLLKFVIGVISIAAIALFSAMFFAEPAKPPFTWPPQDPNGDWPDPDPFPKKWNLHDYALKLSNPVVLEDGEVYRLIGPGRITADFSAKRGATLWMTNCTVNNTSSVPYPQNGIKYVLAGDAYLNFAGLDKPEAPLSDFISSPNDPENYLNRKERTELNNDIRFRGPRTRKELIQLKRDEYFDSWR